MSDKKEMVSSGTSVGKQNPKAAPQPQASMVVANPDVRLGGKKASK